MPRRRPAGPSPDAIPRKSPRALARRRKRTASSLSNRWTTVDDVMVFYRESTKTPDAPVMMHLHGFGLYGQYLVPTADQLAGDFHTFVPDLPGNSRAYEIHRGTYHPAATGS